MSDSERTSHVIADKSLLVPTTMHTWMYMHDDADMARHKSNAERSNKEGYYDWAEYLALARTDKTVDAYLYSLQH